MSAAFGPGFFTTKAPAESVAGDWRLAGWSARVLQLPDDLGREPRATVLEALGATLRLPGAIGSTDALAAALRGISGPTVLVWARGDRFADDHAALWAKVADVLTGRVKAAPPFAVVLAGADRKGL